MNQYVSVIVDLPIKQVNKPFTYQVPDKLKEEVIIGKKVLVPFGNRKIEGYVIGGVEEVNFKTKPISKVVSSFAFFNNELLSLAQWMAEYYQCYLVSALKAIIPSGNNKVKTKRLVKLAQNCEETKEVIENIKNRAPKQAAVLSYLVNNPNNLITTRLAEAVGTTSSTIRTLADKGLVTYKQEEVKRIPYSNQEFDSTTPLDPTEDQLQAIKEITNNIVADSSATILLKGVTGSGKTEVYLQVISKALSEKKETIVLVPEISLTPQTIARFKSRFGNQVAVLHSQLSTGERFDEWRRIKEGSAKIVVGARSAIFAPFENLGLIIIDEEHETSYKQTDHPKYHAREVAVKRAQLNQAVTVLGTATPSLEAYYRTQKGKYQLLELPERIDNRPLPDVELIDMREELKAGNNRMFSKTLQNKLADTLEQGEQSIIFLNRRGFSTFVQCRECGHVMECSSCDVSLTYHAKPNLLKCHYCDYHQEVPDICPECESRYIKYFGVGTQQVETGLKELFPKAKITRMDVDTTQRKGAYRRILSDFKAGKTDILVGTQMVAKGHDFSNVTLVGVITADTALNFPDFRAAERTFQLLTQVAGRTGRGDKPGRVIVQSYTPEHYSIQMAKDHDYKSFYDFEISFREATSYPPFHHLIKVVISDQEEDKVIKLANKLGEIIHSKLHKLDSEGIELLGPVQAPLSKIKDKFRWQLLLKGENIEQLRKVIKQSISETREVSNFKSVKVNVDVDPIGML